MPLTDVKIRNQKPKEKPFRLNDGNGLHIEITPSGGKNWRWRYYFMGKPQIYSIGKYPAISLLEARILCDEARKLVAAGKHPTREKKARKLRQREAFENTFERVATQWFSLREGTLNDKYHEHCVSAMKRHVFPEIGNLAITEITIPDVVTVLEKIGKKGTVEMAKRLKQLINQIFRYACQRGICDKNPAIDLKDILPSTEEKHHACIATEELPALLQGIYARENDLSKLAMQLLALTFVRTGELIGGRWEEIDWEKSEWNIPASRMKMKRPHTVPLSKQALGVFKQLHEQTGKREFMFFSAASKSKHISNGTVLMALRRMGYENKMTGHGFRTLASTILNERAYNPDVIEKQLAHAPKDKIRSAYNRAEYMKERISLMQEYADLLDEIRLSKPSVENEKGRVD